MLLSYLTYGYLDDDSLASLVIIAAVSGFGQLTVLLFGQLIVTAATWQHLRGGQLDMGALLPSGVAGFMTVFLAMLLSYIAISLAMVACVVPGVYLNIRWM